ncbi:sodium-influx-stimulating peptide [Plakobranchus ocellatus]|uniref:Sodium-influx-stimulating peptide n=1 Tax=Plakobranchus ocellatus TaxID=259542 RepID=A0AAV4DXZ0_9GAST|nr:sodium-influx-stimulating peptide [Plakobranchus ocellatus]
MEALFDSLLPVPESPGVRVDVVYCFNRKLMGPNCTGPPLQHDRGGQELRTGSTTMNQAFVWTALVLIFVTTLTTVISVPYLTGECVTMQKVESICYECATRHEKVRQEFILLYTSCCWGVQVYRDYCIAMYSTEAREGGMWE